jgi:hypothetical protein
MSDAVKEFHVNLWEENGSIGLAIYRDEADREKAIVHMSIYQARNLARLLIKYADEAIATANAGVTISGGAAISTKP